MNRNREILSTHLVPFNPWSVHCSTESTATAYSIFIDGVGGVVDGGDDDDDVGDCGGVDDEMMQVHRRVNNNDLRLADSSEDAQRSVILNERCTA